MTNLVAFIGGLVGVVIGWIAATAIAFLVSGYYGVSDFEGQRGMASIFFFGPIGGVIGLIAGTWIALRLRSGGKVGAKALVGRLSIVVVGLAVLVVAIFGALYWFSPVLNSGGRPPQLAFEIKLPRGASIPMDKYSVSLSTERNTMPATLNAGSSLDQSERPVISGTVDLYYRSSWRLIELKAGDRPELIFVLRTSARPGHDAEFGSWQHVSSVGNGTPHPRLATADDAYDIRYRVIWPDFDGDQ